jgi:hypothetical protein
MLGAKSVGQSETDRCNKAIREDATGAEWDIQFQYFL